MTREEAIKNIKEHCYFANLIPQAKKALDMAIKSLEHEDILDKIREEINSPNRGTCDYFIVDQIEEIIDKYKESEK